MELAGITAQQVAVLFLLIFSGFIAVKAKIISLESRKALSNMLLYIITPMMVINSYLSEYDAEIAANLLKALGYSTLALSLAMVVTFLVTIKMKDKDLPILRLACMFSNAGYMGFPLIEALFGAEGLLYASVFLTMFNVFLWTVGYAMASGQVKPRQVLHSICTTPVLYAVVIGVAIYFLRIPLPQVLANPIAMLGNMNTPVSMIITGMLIAGSSLGGVLRDKRILFVMLMRLLVIPALSIALFYVLGLNTGIVSQVVLLLAACPTAAITSVFAVKFGFDEEFAASSVVLTTLCSIVVLPLCAMIITVL